MRNFLIGAACAAAAFGATLSQTSAAVIDHYISGDGTGVLNGVDWSGDFLITIAGDNSTVQNSGSSAIRWRLGMRFVLGKVVS